MAWSDTGGKSEEGRQRDGVGRASPIVPRSCRLGVTVPECKGAISTALPETEGGDCLNYVGGDRLVE